MLPRILVATPVFDWKEYAVQGWFESVAAMQPTDFFMVDNSIRPDFFLRYPWGRFAEHVRRIEIDCPDAPEGGVYFPRLARAAEYVRLAFLKGDCEYWLNLDVDERSTPDLLPYLIDLIGDADVLAHASPNRQLDQFVDGGFGCALFNRRVMESISFLDCPTTGSVGHDVWFFREIARINQASAEVQRQIDNQFGGPVWSFGAPAFVVKQTRGTRILTHLDGMGVETFQHELKVKL